MSGQFEIHRIFFSGLYIINQQKIRYFYLILVYYLYQSVRAFRSCQHIHRVLFYLWYMAHQVGDIKKRNQKHTNPGSSQQNESNSTKNFHISPDQQKNYTRYLFLPKNLRRLRYETCFSEPLQYNKFSLKTDLI